MASGSVERLSHLETRVDGVEDAVSSHGSRLLAIEGSVVDVRLGIAQLHGDLKLNNQASAQIQKSVAEIQADTREMIAVYRATPKMRDNVRWWGYLAGALWATIMAGATLYAALK